MAENVVQDPVDKPKGAFRSMNVTPQHFEELRSLESSGHFVTREHPGILSRYFRGLALRFENFDNAFKTDTTNIGKITIPDLKRGISYDTQLWSVQLERGVKITLTKIRPRYRDKISVRVKQEVD